MTRKPFQLRPKMAVLPIALLLTHQAYSQTVYEGFDYADEIPLAGLNGGIGFDSAWATENGTGPELFVNAGTGPNDNGLNAANLETSGGHIDRSIRTNFTTSYRALSPASVSALTMDGVTMWGSFLYRDGVGDGNNADSSLVFGAERLGLANNHVLNSANYALGLLIGERTIFTEAAFYDNATAATFSTTPSTLTDSDILDTTSLFVFSVEWNASGVDDVLSFYRVLDVNSPLPAPFSTITFDIDAATQATFNTISIVETQGGEFDEIRLGTSLASVTPAAVPTGVTILASEELIESGEVVNLSITFNPAAASASLATPSGPLDLIALDDGSTNGDLTAGDGIVSVPEMPTTSFTYVATATDTGGASSDAEVGVLVADPTSVPSNALSAAIVGDLPLFYYRFEEGVDEGFLTDVSGNGFHTSDISGGLGQGVAPVPGGVQNVGQFPDDTGIRVTGATSNISEAYTLAAVVNSANIQAGAENFFSMTDGTGTGRSIFGLNVGSFETFTGGQADAIPVTALPNSETSFLVHCVFEPDAVNTAPVDFVSGVMSVYIDGNFEGSAAIETEINEGEWVLGSHKNRGFNFFEGFLDEVAVFESALTATQIADQGAAFLTAGDPLLGYTTEDLVINNGDSVTLDWKISDQATAVSINGNSQTISGGGVYQTVFTPTEDTTYIISVTHAGGTITSELDVIVEEVQEPAVITSISTDGATPPNVTIEILGDPNSTYFLEASANLQDGFPEPLPSITTDATGVGSASFEGVGEQEFYRLEPIE